MRRNVTKGRAPSVVVVVNGEALVAANNVGSPSLRCSHCGTFKFAWETPNMCCFSRKVHVEDLPNSPQLFINLWNGQDYRSTVFRKYCRQLNNALCLASLKIGESSRSVGEGYNPTVMIHVGSLSF